MVLIGPGSRDLSCEPTPHPAYGSEFSTDGNRLVRAREGNGAGCRFTPRPVLPCFAGLRTRGRFPFPLPPRTIGEQKAKVKAFSKLGCGPISGNETYRALGRVSPEPSQ